MKIGDTLVFEALNEKATNANTVRRVKNQPLRILMLYDGGVMAENLITGENVLVPRRLFKPVAKITQVH